MLNNFCFHVYAQKWHMWNAKCLGHRKKWLHKAGWKEFRVQPRGATHHIITCDRALITSHLLIDNTNTVHRTGHKKKESQAEFDVRFFKFIMLDFSRLLDFSRRIPGVKSWIKPWLNICLVWDGSTKTRSTAVTAPILWPLTIHCILSLWTPKWVTVYSRKSCFTGLSKL